MMQEDLPRRGQENLRENLIAGILAGGQSRRLGTDKALIQWRGRSLLEWAVQRASALTNDVYILAKQQEPYERAGVPVLVDFSTTVTPLSGILSVSPFVKEWLLLLACDIVIFSNEILEKIWERREPGKAVVVRSEQGLQPFLGLYPAEHLSIWEEAYRSGNYKLQPALEGMKRIVLDSQDLEKEIGESPLFVNVNRPEDLDYLSTLGELNTYDGKGQKISSYQSI